MKRLALGIIAVAASFIIADVSAAMSVNDYPAGAAANGIAGTRHNLGAFGRVIKTNGTTEICVFCHAPHHGNPDTGPLWNRTNASQNFVPYGGTIGGSTVGNPGGATLACLSCHDGITTFDTLINAPGKGNGATGNNKVPTDQGWTFFMPNGEGLVKFGPGGIVIEPLDHLGSANCTSCHKANDYWGTVGRLNIGQAFSETGIENTAVTLTDDHPVSVTYVAGRASLRDPGTVIGSIDLTDGLASTNVNISQNRWAVGGNISETATINDILRDGKVECSSCHDPHFDNLSWDEAEATWDVSGVIGYSWCSSGEDCTDGNFLRRVGGNTGSGVCRTCHNK